MSQKPRIALALLWLAIPLRAMGADPVQKRQIQEFTQEKLSQAGMRESFIRSINQVRDDVLISKIVELNVLGFMGTADYSSHFSKKAVLKCREFIRKHLNTLTFAEKKYGVSKEIISALLWVETKHGKMVGSYPVASVYYSLLQADHPTRMNQLLESAKARGTSSLSEQELKNKIEERSKAKATWALEQLQALEKIGRLNTKKIVALKGSYAGAFGMPQFIPTSYLSWGKSIYRKRNPDLFVASDAIVSVANYLHSQGWKKNDSESWRRALFHYNRSVGYGEVILKIASAL